MASGGPSKRDPRTTSAAGGLGGAFRACLVKKKPLVSGQLVVNTQLPTVA